MRNLCKSFVPASSFNGWLWQGIFLTCCFKDFVIPVYEAGMVKLTDDGEGDWIWSGVNGACVMKR